MRAVVALTAPHPRVFCEKSVQAIENKRWELQKERQEILRGGKLLKRWDLPPRPGRGRQGHRERRGGEGMDGEYRRGDTPVATGSMRNVLRMGEILANILAVIIASRPCEQVTA